MKILSLLLVLMLCFTAGFAQQKQGIDMADAFYSSGRIYVVIAVVVLIFTGLTVYLFSIDRRLKKIEKEK